MDIQSIENSSPLHLGPLRLVDEEETGTSFFAEEQSEAEKENLPSPMMLARTEAKAKTKITSSAQVEKFLLSVFTRVGKLNELRADQHHQALQDNFERKEALQKELDELGVRVERDGTISFYLGYATTAATVVTVGATLLSFFTGGTALVVAGASAFLGAWAGAVKSYFDINRDQFESDSITVRMNIGVAMEDGHRHTEVISGNLQEMTRLLEDHFKAIQDQGNIRKKIISSI